MPNRPDKLCLLICRHYLREVEAVIGSGGFEDIIVRHYPPTCVSPHRAQDVLREVLKVNRDEGNDLFFLGSCFSSSAGLLSILPEGCGVYPIEECSRLLAGKSLIDDYIRDGAYAFSPGWLEEWPAHVAQGETGPPPGIFSGKTVTRLVLLDTGIYDGSSEILKEFAFHIDRPFLVVPVGLDHFRLVLTNIVLKWRLEKTRRKWQTASAQVNRKLADQSVPFELLAGLTRMKTESEAIEQIMNLFVMLFSPGRMVYASVVNGLVGKSYTYPIDMKDNTRLQDWLDKGREENIWIEAQKGFNLRLTYQEQTLGLLEVKDIAFPEYRPEYLTMATLFARVCGLAIANGRLFQEVRHHAITDSLTALYNRRHFFYLAMREFSHAGRYNRPLAALMLDIDHFKNINDTYGHVAGDQVLIELARLCRQELRATDICGRYGGEEFVFLLPETSMEGARQMAERLCMAISGLTVMVEGKTVNITASLGVAVMDKDCPNVEELLNRSDQALYDAKRGGRNRVSMFEPRSVF
jgi:diguanylate cyclase (GGDEF)-like protein